MTNTVLEVSNLVTCFGETRVVAGIDFHISAGETFVLLGESGSGKSITALSILRLLPHAARICAGQVCLNGHNLLALPEASMRHYRGARIAMIFQEPHNALNPVLSIGQQLSETVAYHKQFNRKAARAYSIELLQSVGIAEADRCIVEYPHQLSGGMKQRVMIAMALAAEPELLIADEPTTALDVTIQSQILSLLQRLQADKGMALLFITHDLGVAAQIADRIAVMQQGRIVEEQACAALINHPQHPYTQTLLDAVPNREKRIRDQVVPSLSDSDTATIKTPLLSVHGLKVHFPIKKGLFKRTVGQVRAVDGISFTIQTGQTLALVGESGSGKTTTGRAILRLIECTEGRVCYTGDHSDTLSKDALRQRRRDIQVVFQDPYSSMNPRMLITDIIQEGMRAHNVRESTQQREQKVDTLLEQVGLAPQHKYRYPHEFSGGQRQRICIARALAVEPNLLICDEPTSALDVSVQAQILKLLIELQRKFSLSYLLITHDISVVEYLAHRVAVMYRGQIVEQGGVDEVLQEPRHHYTQELLAAVPRLSNAAATGGRQT